MNLVEDIANEMKSALGELVVAITVYGSYAQGTFNENSDIDYYLVLNKINLDDLKKIAKLKIDLQNKYKIDLSLNIIKEKELPKFRKKAFFHKNRYALFLHEANKMDKIICGSNPFATQELPSLREIRLESIRLINSWAYTVRKILVNKGDINPAIKDALRFSIYSTQYANASNGNYPLSTSDSIKKFKNDFKDFGPSKNIDQILKWKTENVITADKEKVYSTCLDFLEKLDEYLYDKFGEEL